MNNKPERDVPNRSTLYERLNNSELPHGYSMYIKCFVLKNKTRTVV